MREAIKDVEVIHYHMKSYVGIDEAGAGCFYGPVCAAAVWLHPSVDMSLIDDSKKLSDKKRRVANEQIKLSSLVGIGMVDAIEIDDINT